ncbi:MAG TPA: DMT family transporter [Anaerolineales bacterium]|nr:DMT family transporter [Anaerolineales bacterium]
MRLKADLLLLLVTVIWGSAFAVMRFAAGHGTVFYLNGLRFLLGALVVLPLAKLKGKFNRKNIVYVVLAGFALFAGVAFQQAGLATTSAGNGGFITSLYVVVVPFILWIFWRERPSTLTWVAVLLAVAGGFLLSTGGSFRVRAGDVLVFIGSFFWAMHVVVVGKVQGKIEAVPFAFGQFAICAMLNLGTAVFVEHPTRVEMLLVLPAILYTGILSIAVGFTLQVIAQKHTPENDAALIMSLESVFAVFFGWLFLQEKLLPIQLAGCALILLAVGLVQVRNGKMRTT